jgi:hypothetical protein
MSQQVINLRKLQKSKIQESKTSFLVNFKIQLQFVDVLSTKNGLVSKPFKTSSIISIPSYNHPAHDQGP